MLESDRSGTLSRLVSAHSAERGVDRPVFTARFDGRLQPVLTITLGAASLVFALVLQLFFLKKERPYGAHLMFALHYGALICLLTIAAGASRTIGVSTDVSRMAAYASIVPYLILALKRVYSEPTGVILVKAGALLLVTFALNTVVNRAAIELTLALV